MIQCFQRGLVFLGILLAVGGVAAQEPLRLENSQIGLTFDRKTGTLTAIENKLVGETYQIRGEEFGIEASEFKLAQGDLKLVSLDRQGDAVKARYEGKGMTVEAVYTLHGDNHFAEKQLTVTSNRKMGLIVVKVSHPTFSAAGLRMVAHHYPLSKQESTFFGRTAKGGFFTGLEVSRDDSVANGNEVALRYIPGLKVAAGERFVCDPAYFGVYRRGRHDKEDGSLPIRSESDAMVAMTSTILGPSRFGFVAAANGWGSEMHQDEFTEASLAKDMKALDTLVQCGIEWCSDAHAWGGQWASLNNFGPNDQFEPSPLLKRFLEHSQKVGVKMVLFSTLNNSFPWWMVVGTKKSRAFRDDQPDWRLDAGNELPAGTEGWRGAKEGINNAGGNCLGCRDFEKWLTRINLEVIAKSPYPGWCMDGDFFGGAGVVFPANCRSDKHDHVPEYSEYACQQALTRLMGSIRQHCPRTSIQVYRPSMDLGVWSLRNVDICFTLNEEGTGSDNVAAGNQIRTWSRKRVHHNFFPHYMDQPLLFPACWDHTPENSQKWPKSHFDYILLSALSSAPNQLYYFPLKSGFPDKDKAEIKKWLDWGRKNVAYLMVRKDLPDWPAADKIDGSAHIVGDHGLIFLFNPSKKALTGEFDLTDESIGLKAAGNFQIDQEYPAANRKITSAAGQTVRWEIPPTTAVVLRIQPAAQ